MVCRLRPENCVDNHQLAHPGKIKWKQNIIALILFIFHSIIEIKWIQNKKIYPVETSSTVDSTRAVENFYCLLFIITFKLSNVIKIKQCF